MGGNVQHAETLATLRARLGVNFMSQGWTGLVAERLDALGYESQLLRKSTKLVIASFKQISEAVVLI